MPEMGRLYQHLTESSSHRLRLNRRPPPPATPKGDEVMDVDATAPGERLTKKQKLEQTQDAVLELTNLVKVILDGLSGLHETLTQNT